MGESFKNLGVVSIGEMGLGIASLLIAHGYYVFTYAADRRLYSLVRKSN
jgi:3-hydroxyacyl-CoA dehydrogenase